jgi:hypothetical protein
MVNIISKMWTPDDVQESTLQGWMFEPVGSLAYLPDGSVYSSKLLMLVWRDPEITGHTWEDDLAKFIAEAAARGEPFYERAWLFYCYLELNGLLFRTPRGEIVHREFNFRPKQ